MPTLPYFSNVPAPLPVPAPPRDYRRFRGRAFIEVEHGDFKLAVHYLGNAMLSPDFSGVPNEERARILRSFGKTVNARLMEMIAQRDEAGKSELKEAPFKLRSLGMRRRLIEELATLYEQDMGALRVLGSCVAEMSRCICSMCDARYPRYDAPAFAELEACFDVEGADT